MKSTAPSNSNSEAHSLIAHMFTARTYFLLGLLVCCWASTAPAQQAAEKSAQPGAPQPGVLRLLPSDATSEKEIDVGGRKLAYTATAGTLSLYDQTGERTAAIFYTAYVAKNEPNRPLTFAFNGGPGAASAYLHLGLVGPRVI